MAKKIKKSIINPVKISENKSAIGSHPIAEGKQRPLLPLVVICGPTASGKTGLAIELAQQFGGEIICADSRTVYKGMDIGTAKPTEEERVAVPHWGLDLVEPGERFTAADFKQYAVHKIDEIRTRGNVPFLVGGSGLYVDGVILDYEFAGDINTTQRESLEKMTITELQKHCLENNVELPVNSKNKRYLVRAIERKSINVKRRETPIDNCIVVGIATKRDILRKRIEDRAEHLFTNGVVDEARILGKKYGWDNEAMTGNVYPIALDLLAEKITLNEAKAKFTTSDWRLAKRQLTWLHRHEFITWLSLADARTYLQNVLGVV